jgi:hypothetical protein
MDRSNVEEDPYPRRQRQRGSPTMLRMRRRRQLRRLHHPRERADAGSPDQMVSTGWSRRQRLRDGYPRCGDDPDGSVAAPVLTTPGSTGGR